MPRRDLAPGARRTLAIGPGLLALADTAPNGSRAMMRAGRHWLTPGWIGRDRDFSSLPNRSLEGGRAQTGVWARGGKYPGIVPPYLRFLAPHAHRPPRFVAPPPQSIPIAQSKAQPFGHQSVTPAAPPIAPNCLSISLRGVFVFVATSEDRLQVRVPHFCSLAYEPSFVQGIRDTACSPHCKGRNGSLLGPDLPPPREQK